MSLLVGRSAIHGKGLFSSIEFKNGELIGVFQGVPTSAHSEHVLWVEQDDGKLLPYMISNELKYANHSITPNSEVLGVEMYALRDINMGEEITFDYGDDWH
jgi:hypothetical protein